MAYGVTSCSSSGASSGFTVAEQGEQNKLSRSAMEKQTQGQTSKDSHFSFPLTVPCCQVVMQLEVGSDPLSEFLIQRDQKHLIF